MINIDDDAESVDGGRNRCTKVGRHVAAKHKDLFDGCGDDLWMEDNTGEVYEDEADNTKSLYLVWKTTIELELDKYKNAAGLSWKNKNGDYLDPLQVWWKLHSLQYPNVWRVAEKYLAIPASASSSERAFSLAGIIVSAKQTQTNPLNVEDLHFLNQNWEYMFD